MNNRITSARDIFAALDSDHRSKKWSGQEQLLTRQMKLSDEINCIFGVRKLDGRHVLFIKYSPENAIQVQSLPTWKGIEIEYSMFNNPGIDGNYIRIGQSDISDNEVYFAVCDDLCKNLEGISIKDLKTHLEAVLERWKRFFALRGRISLSREEQLGLFGELWLLRNMLEKGFGYQAIKSWKGPYHGIFDFSMPGMSVEVKTSTAKAPYKAYISNEVQLDERIAGGELVLFFIAVQPSESSGESLADIVSFIESIVSASSVSLQLVQDKLCGVGLGKSYIDNYKTKYIVKEINYLRVHENFPRIILSNLSSGIGDISYSIDISACERFKIDEETFWIILNSHSEGASNCS